MFYTNEEFLTEFEKKNDYGVPFDGLKEGFNAYRKELDKQNYLKPDEKLHDIHVTIFDDTIMIMQEGETESWEQAAEHMVQQYEHILSDTGFIADMEANEEAV